MPIRAFARQVKDPAVIAFTTDDVRKTYDELPTYLFASMAAAAIYLLRMTLTNAPLWLA